MDIYLIRHAEAAPLGEGGVIEDAARPLTERGHEQAKALAASFQRRGIQIPVIASSPLLRARQTAEGIGNALPQPGPEVRIAEDLAPGGKRRRLGRFVRDQGAQSVALVGHEPDLSEFTAWLIGSRKAQIELAKAGVACVHCEAGPGKGEGTLRWLVTLELLA
jgi:phosphohistidine phosphatase